MTIPTWLVQNLTTIVIGLIILAALVLYVHKHRKGLLAKAALYAVAKAEEMWGSDTGRIKFAEVYTYLQTQYPILTLFFTQAQITLIIEDALTQMKEILATKAAKEKALAAQVEEAKSQPE